MYVRWLGAFRTEGYSLKESFLYEMTRTSDVACEHFKSKSEVRARVGLLVKPSAVYKHYDGDVWSEYDHKGNLHPTRKPWQAYSKHTECFAKPEYTGIVLEKRSFKDLQKRNRLEIIEFLKEYEASTGIKLPVYKIVNGKLIPETI